MVENAGEDGKTYLVQIIRPQCYYVEVKFPKNAGSMEEAIESAKEISYLNMINESDWENMDYDYYVVEQYDEDDSI